MPDHDGGNPIKSARLILKQGKFCLRFSSNLCNFKSAKCHMKCTTKVGDNMGNSPVISHFSESIVNKNAFLKFSHEYERSAPIIADPRNKKVRTI